MKCKECGFKLKNFYFAIAGKEFCSKCASEFINDISDFKVQLNNSEVKKCVRKAKKLG